MTIQEFKRSITKASWFDKYYYYLISLTVISLGFYFLYLALFNKTKNLKTESQIAMLASSIFLIALGGISLHLIPNLYKILTFDCTATSSVKKKIISETMKDLNAFFIDNPKNYWTFRYQRGCWTFDFNVYLTFNDTNLLASVVGCTSSGGFIDFGQTERLRKKLNKIVMEKIKQV